ncbi:MAG: cation-translocating P-type ATPase [Planctomycetes bacterium]|nr:cation-translocating P-type ATPase [Planctomycetota bacterium]
MSAKADTSPAPNEPQGLSEQEAAQRLARDGPNVISRKERVTPLRMFARQFANPLIWLLVAAAVLSGILREWVDAAAIVAIVAINALVGFVQEFRAERALQALRAMTAPRATVVRGGKRMVIAASEVVVGDVLALEAGDIVAADARILQAHNLAANEAPLTGESVPVTKGAPAAKDAALSERTDHVFSGTSIARGAATAEVVAVAMATELGKIANLLAGARESVTPLQRRLASLSRTLIVVCVVIAVGTGLLTLLRGHVWLDVLMISVSLAVATVPEGLPAVVTIALALGVHRMARRHVLVRRMAAIETLGCATIICTDKTGTLTTGVMAVREVWGADADKLLAAAAACCDAELGRDGKPATGDPTEVAILAEAARKGIERGQIERDNPRVQEHPFDSETKRMAILRKDGVMYVKGALESLLAVSSTASEGAKEAEAKMAAGGLRVLAVATGTGGEIQGLTLVGLIGMADPPREEAKEAVELARQAGIRTIMLTGDHPTTARAIATELGILKPGESPEGVVFARVTAEQKLMLVRDLKARGEVVAMTGDGVNDAPALKEAHIGIAMGKTGTEVTREAADLVLTDDNYASIVAAVAEGRSIYGNIRKALIFVMTGNVTELMVVLVAAILGWPIPLNALQLLWINLVSDGPPGLALVNEPSEPGVMKTPPRPTKEALMGRAQWLYTVVPGFFETICVLGVYGWALGAYGQAHAGSLAFSALVICQLFRVFAARSERQTTWQVGLFTNKSLLAVFAVSMGIQIMLHQVPATAKLLNLQPLTWTDVGLVMGVGVIPLTVLEIYKLFRWRKEMNRAS